MSAHQIQAIELNIQEAHKIIDLGKALERLEANRDFKQVISEGYFKNEAVRLVHLKADPAMQSDERQKNIVAQMDAVGSLAQYFQTVFHKARLAEKAVEADEEARDELLAEELAK